MNELYRAVEISKQAVSQYARRQAVFDEKTRSLLAEAEVLRAEHPGCGVEKMYYTLAPEFIGRDRFVELFMRLGFRLKRGKNYRRTTYAGPLYFSNLIQGMVINGPCQVWQSDITYIQVGQRFYYAVFIVDVYTRLIVGYQVSDNMRATANLKALEMALKDHGPPLIHHSDRGSQYSCKSYTDLLKANGCRISMALSAQDNAYAERINRTIKEEYLDYWKPHDYTQLKKCVLKAVRNYNMKRLHKNIGRVSPEYVRNKYYENDCNNLNTFTIFDNNKPSKNGQH
jgi:putative transposase